LDLPRNTVKIRWVGGLTKDTTILERGDLVTRTGNMKYTCRVDEVVLGDLGNQPDTVIINTDTPIGGTGGAGVDVQNS
jgi:hypothetical protein